MAKRISRRRLLRGLGGAGFSAGLAANSFAQADDDEPFPENPAEAMGQLVRGNVRFASGDTLHAHQSAEWRMQLLESQKPFATILGCSDSRVPVELVFDQGFGDLFTVRVAGNVVAPDIVGTLEYALEHLKTQLVVVLGHQSCGAVTAAVNAIEQKTRDLPGIEELLGLIEPGLPRTLLGDSLTQRIAAAVEANVRWSVKQLGELEECQDALAAGTVEIHGAVYDLATGRVRFLN